jgi:hypothetical protein
VKKPKGCFPLWPEVERPSFSTNQIARNQDYGLSTLHIRGQSPKAVAFQNARMAIFFDQGDGLLKEAWVGQEWKPKLWLRGRQFLFIIKLKTERSWLLIGGLFWTWNKVGCSFFIWTLSLTFGGFTSSHYSAAHMNRDQPLRMAEWMNSSPLCAWRSPIRRREWQSGPSASTYKPWVFRSMPSIFLVALLRLL